MRGDRAAFDVAQFVGERLGDDFHSRLADVVGGIARRAGDPLFRTGVDDRAGRVLRDHRGGEDLHAMNDAPEVDVKDGAPARGVAKQAAAGPFDPCVVHQQGDLAKGLIGRILEALHILSPRDVGDDAANRPGARGMAGDLGDGGVERRGVDVGEPQLHAEPGEFYGGGKADAAGGAGDDGDAIFREGGVKHVRSFRKVDRKVARAT